MGWPRGTATAVGRSHCAVTILSSATQGPTPVELLSQEAGRTAPLLLLQGLQEEGLDLGAQMEAAQPLIQGNPNHQHKVDRLSADYQALQRSLEVRGRWGTCAGTHTRPLGLSPPYLLHSFQPFCLLSPFLSSFPHSLGR